MKKVCFGVLCTLILLFSTAAFAQDIAYVGDRDAFFAAVADGSATTIQLTASMDLTGAGVLNVDGMTIDLGGYTISAANFSLIFQGSNLVIQNGAFDSKGGNYALFIGDAEETSDILVQNVALNGGINVFNAGGVTLKDVTVTAVNYYAVWCDENARVTIESGTYQTGEKSVALLGLTSAEYNTSLVIQGGSFLAGDKPMVLVGNADKQYGTPVISGGFFDAAVDEAYLAEGYNAIARGDGSGYDVQSETNPEPVTPPEEVAPPEEVTPPEEAPAPEATAAPAAASAPPQTGDGAAPMLWLALAVFSAVLAIGSGASALRRREKSR